MADLIIRAHKVQSITSEYGYPMQANETFQALVPLSMHGGDRNIALALVYNAPAIAQAAGSTCQIEDRLADGTYVVRGQRTRLNAARAQNDFQWTYGTGLIGETTSIDNNDEPLWVLYDGVYQIASTDIEIPTFEFRAVGIRNTKLVGTPSMWQEHWIGHVNTDTFLGVNPGKLRCIQANAEPHYISESVEMHRLELILQGRFDGHGRIIYWVDPSTGRPPYTLDPTEWSRSADIYPQAAFNELWPFGTEGLLE